MFMSAKHYRPENTNLDVAQKIHHNQILFQFQAADLLTDPTPLFELVWPTKYKIFVLKQPAHSIAEKN